jgi:cytochrome c biogenesis protein CcmG, thiol:disulfide interchange protein DsbE
MSGTKPPQTSKSNRTAVVVATVLLGVVAMFVVAMLLTRGSSNSSADSADTSLTASDVVQETSEVSVTGTALPAFPEGDVADPALGLPAPTVNGQNFSGQSESIAPGKRAMVLTFVAHWCSHCQREVPKLADWARGGTRNDVDVRVVATSTQKDLPNYPPSAWLAKEGLDAPTLADDAGGTAAAAYGLTAFPFFVAVDAKGDVVARASGELSEAEFDALVAKAKSA